MNKKLQIALSGYGRMGREVEKVAIERGHNIIAKFDSPADWSRAAELSGKCDVMIDFSLPHTAPNAIKTCFDLDIPVVSGTTNWENELALAKKRCIEEGKSFFYAPNFSIGVNIFFEINKKLAELLKNDADYLPHIHEVHHIHKLDAPSGTAKALAGQISGISNFFPNGWVNPGEKESGTFEVSSERQGEVPGTHIVTWSSVVDQIQITHTAHSRAGFVHGAVKAAEWLAGKKGCFGMSDMLGI